MIDASQLSPSLRAALEAFQRTGAVLSARVYRMLIEKLRQRDRTEDEWLGVIETLSQSERDGSLDDNVERVDQQAVGLPSAGHPAEEGLEGRAGQEVRLRSRERSPILHSRHWE